MTAQFADFSDEDKLKMLDEAMIAASFTWMALRDIKFDAEYDDPGDVALHNEVLKTARERHPWLDEAADAMAESAKVTVKAYEDGLLDG